MLKSCLLMNLRPGQLDKVVACVQRLFSTSSVYNRSPQQSGEAKIVWESEGVKEDVLKQDNPDPRQFLSYFVTHGKGFKTSLEAYDDNKVADTYNKSIQAVNYTGALACADMAAAVTSKNRSRHSVKIIDIAAGTGAVGKELYNLGFRDITSHDGAQAMVDFCKTTGFYKDYICHPLYGLGSLPTANDTYDMATAAGAFVPNHIPTEGLRELARIVKAGGFVLNVYRDGILDSEYGAEYEDFRKQLQKDNIWRMYGRFHFPNYNFKSDGIVDMFKIC